MSGINGFWGNSISMVEKSLDYLWEKQQAISNNIANAETPGYKSKYVTFEENYRSRLQDAMKAKNPSQVQKAISGARTTVRESAEETARLDGNNVNADVQLIEMSRTALQYQYGLSSINSDIARLSTAIKGQ
ncbi:flagellar basal body rod protein FlgB [Muricomes intestini]|uniref:Flagellar basal body rod protein FlgB n=1 Tax=Muricomes intestini TaxID=1796634 RepID=A0A4R3KHY8_9FIRM|nr:flagellar basal body rod protein FlgB [Muricomes intestini]TCS82769.1 flagellar basal-body rod protein FlgB [Muricomes intestini]HAX52589.1 flagellar basal body rod protein FlgB [Lachnospiraceae bacterium]HCR83115.1 flagellar basal body rod protein FlgB [Lachnospiraceae bacterium]